MGEPVKHPTPGSSRESGGPSLDKFLIILWLQELLLRRAAKATDRGNLNHAIPLRSS